MNKLPDLSNRQSKQQTYAELVRKKGERKGKKWVKNIVVLLEETNKKILCHVLGFFLNDHYITEKIPLSAFSKILFLRHDAIGDMIVSLPLWHVLKRRNPHLKIGVVGSYRNIDVIREDPCVDQIFCFDTSDKPAFRAELKKVQAERYDVVVMCKLNQKTRGAILARKCSPRGITVSVAPSRAIPHHKLYNATAHFPLANPPANHMAERLMHMMEEVFDLGQVNPEEKTFPLSIDANVLAQVDSQLAASHAQFNTTWHIVLNVQARNDFQEWGFTNSLAFAETITAHYPDLLVVITCASSREQAVLSILAEHQSCGRILYFPTPDLHRMFALVKRCRLVVTPDTSVVHMASAEGKPCVAFYPRRSEWLPYQTPSFVLLPEPGQPPCSISVDQALSAAKILLDPHSAPCVNRSVSIIDCANHPLSPQA